MLDVDVGRIFNQRGVMKSVPQCLHLNRSWRWKINADRREIDDVASTDVVAPTSRRD